MGSQCLKWLSSFAVPGGLLLLAAVGFLRPHGLPAWTLPLVHAYAYVVLGAGLLLGWYFDRSRIVFATVVLAVADRALLQFSAGDAATEGVGRVVFNAVALLVPLNLLALSLIERGIVTLRGAVRLGLMLAQVFFVAWLCRPEQAEVAASLELAYVDPRWMGWTPIAQPALLAFGAAVVLQTIRFLSLRNVIESGFVWALAASFIGLHGTRLGWEPTNFFATAGLILAVALVEDSYNMTYYDELTGVRGRHAFNEALLTLGNRYVVAMADIDRFKQVNDLHGRDVGDQMLRMVATKIAEVSGGGKAFRYGGGAFAVLFPGKSVEETLPHLERLREAVEAGRFLLSGRGRLRLKQDQPSSEGRTLDKELSVTISLGAAPRNEKRAKPDLVIKAAERALLRAKRGGRNQVKAER